MILNNCEKLVGTAIKHSVISNIVSYYYSDFFLKKEQLLNRYNVVTNWYSKHTTSNLQVFKEEDDNW